MSHSKRLSRRELLHQGIIGLAGVMGAAGVSSVAHALTGKSDLGAGSRLDDPAADEPAQRGRIIMRTIPGTAEQLPVIGLGTARGFDSRDAAQRSQIQQLIRTFSDLGGKLIETSPAYGEAESVIGAVIGDSTFRERLFVATTIMSTSSLVDAQRELEQSRKALRIDRIDLVQLPANAGTSLHAMLRDEKAAGRVRYVGVIAPADMDEGAVLSVIQRERFDSLQVPMSVDERGAARRVLPAAAERGLAVLISHPFNRGRVFERVLGKALPAWARDTDAASWAQLFLKYLASDPAVTCVVPGSDRPEYLRDNLGALRGRLPNEALRRRIEALFR